MEIGKVEALGNKVELTQNFKRKQKQNRAIAFSLLFFFNCSFSTTPLVLMNGGFTILCFFGAENEHVSTLTPDADRGQLFREREEQNMASWDKPSDGFGQCWLGRVPYRSTALPQVPKLGLPWILSTKNFAFSLYCLQIPHFTLYPQGDFAREILLLLHLYSICLHCFFASLGIPFYPLIVSPFGFLFCYLLSSSFLLTLFFPHYLCEYWENLKPHLVDSPSWVVLGYVFLFGSWENQNAKKQRFSLFTPFLFSLLLAW